VLSSLGFLVAPISYEVAQGKRCRLDDISWPSVRALYGDMRSQVESFLRDAQVDAAGIRFEFSALMSYEGQGYEVGVQLPENALEDGRTDALRAAFDERYHSLYGTLNGDFSVQVLSWKLLGAGPLPLVRLAGTAALGDGSPRPRNKGKRLIYAGVEHGLQSWPVYDRNTLTSTSHFDGPAVIEERESTVVVPPGARVWLDGHGTLVIDLPSAKAASAAETSVPCVN